MEQETSREKALRINLDQEIYGSFAEIGAGQEVAATFFQAGGSSGTIALSHSAYDMKISDSIYGECRRYVSMQRLESMLKKDYQSIVEKLEFRKDRSRFFAFANTVETLNYHKTNQGHGWFGVSFQSEPNGEPNTVIVHANLLDNENLLQQKAVGRLGVNLLYACFFIDDMDQFILSLLDSLSKERIEVDMFNVSGPAFEHIDNRLLSLKLVKNGLSPVAMFGPDGNNVQASEKLYKKNILVLRGRFRPPTLVNVDMLLSAYRQFKRESDVERENLVVLCELTLNNLTNKGEQIDEKDFLDRVDILCSLGQTVIITNYQRYYRLVTFLSNINKERKIGVIMGVNNLAAIFDKKYYKHLKGGILEAFGKLFGRNVKLLIYPATNGTGDGLHSLENFLLPEKLYNLFQYLIDTNKIEDIDCINKGLLEIYSDDVLEMIKNNEAGWEKMVPNKVAKAIKRSKLFNYQVPNSEKQASEGKKDISKKMLSN